MKLALFVGLVVPQYLHVLEVRAIRNAKNFLGEIGHPLTTALWKVLRIVDAGISAASIQKSQQAIQQCRARRFCPTVEKSLDTIPITIVVGARSK